jgi:divalent metal cation (Fe/Co/Zn/Cd) transporter
MDAVDPELVDQATAAVATVGGISGIRELRIRWIGHTLRAEVDASVDPALTVTEAHDIAHHAERHLLREVRRLTAANVHVSPTGEH